MSPKTFSITFKDAPCELKVEGRALQISREGCPSDIVLQRKWGKGSVRVDIMRRSVQVTFPSGAGEASTPTPFECMFRSPDDAEKFKKVFTRSTPDSHTSKSTAVAVEHGARKFLVTGNSQRTISLMRQGITHKAVGRRSSTGQNRSSKGGASRYGSLSYSRQSSLVSSQSPQSSPVGKKRSRPQLTPPISTPPTQKVRTEEINLCTSPEPASSDPSPPPVASPPKKRAMVQKLIIPYQGTPRLASDQHPTASQERENKDLEEAMKRSLQDTKSIRGGFYNLGNSCYMNAVLESLLSIREFCADLRTTVQALPSSITETTTTLFQLLDDIVQQRKKSPMRSIGLSVVKELIEAANDRFVGCQQQDAHEFLCTCFVLLEEEHQRLMKKRRPTIFASRCEEPVMKNFRGQIEYTLACCQCHHEETLHEDFYFLNLSLGDEDMVDVNQLLATFFEEEEVERKCEECQHQYSVRRVRVSRLPRVLILQLQRFRYDHEDNAMHKVHTRVAVQPSISLESFSTVREKTEYQLRASVNHVGSGSSGHYTCSIFHSADICDMCDDSIVRTGNHHQGVVKSRNGYLLFYLQSQLYHNYSPPLL